MGSKRSKRKRSSAFWRHVANIYRLTIKELRSIRSDPIMLALIAYSFTFAIYAAATGASTEATFGSAFRMPVLGKSSCAIRYS